jgi:prepilin-type N-terminal cleavage/methylation domain-containing protein
MSNRRGFTIIELLVVVVIVGLLATIAVPKFASTKDKSKMASVRSDLRNVLTAQEAYFADNNAFGTLNQIQATGSFLLSPGNTGSVNVASGNSGYTAVIQNTTIQTGFTQCTVQYAGGVSAAVDGVMVCS